MPDKVIVCDGVYPARGEPAALGAIAAVAQRHDAVIYIDDAHGVGLLGMGPTAASPYGRGGGGTPRLLGVPPDAFVHVGSLSKALGVPVAFVAGPAGFMTHLRLTAGAFTHSSPPALPVLAAGLAAIEVNAVLGDALRRRLAARVRRFRCGLTAAGIRPETRGLFPVQTLGFTTPRAALAAGRALRAAGVWPVVQLHPPERPQGGALRFVLTALHTEADVDAAIEAVARVMHCDCHRTA